MARPRHHPIRLQHIVLESLLHRIVEVGNVALALEKRIGVLVDLAARRCRKADEQRVKILEDRAVLVED